MKAALRFSSKQETEGGLLWIVFAFIRLPRHGTIDSITPDTTEPTAASASTDVLVSSRPVGTAHHANQVVLYDVISLGLFIFKGN